MYGRARARSLTARLLLTFMTAMSSVPLHIAYIYDGEEGTEEGQGGDWMVLIMESLV